MSALGGRETGLVLALYLPETWQQDEGKSLTSDEIIAHLIFGGYPLHAFSGQFDYSRARRIVVLYPHLLAEPQLEWLDSARKSGMIRTFGVFAPQSEVLTEAEKNGPLPL